MIKQLLSLISVGTFSLAFMSPLPYLKNANLNNNKLIKNTTINDKKWIDSIKESSDTNFPKIFFTRNASLAYQQAILAAEYMLLANTNRVDNDDILFFYDNPVYTKDTWSAKEWEQKYLKTNSTTNDWSFKLVNNTSKISDDLESFDYVQYPTENITNSILKYYEKTSDIKFDLWIIDASLEELFFNNNSTYEFMKHINKVYVLSDGNYQSYTFVKNWINYFLSKGRDYKQLTQEEVEEKFKQYREDTTNSLKSEFQNYKLYDFTNDENIFTFFHTNSYTDSDYYNQTYDLGNVQLYKTYKMNYNYYDLATKLFSDNSDTSKKNINIFLEDYERFFKIYNFNNLSDYIWKNSEKYDPTKKNLIWLGDSLIKNKSHAYSERLKEERNIMQSWLKMFPLDQYNFFAKNHPAYIADSDTTWSTNIPDAITGQVQLSNLIINNEEQASNVIYFQNVPWEIFLSWDYKQQKTNSNYTPIFNSNPSKDNTIFVGFQYTTTSIQTTAFFLEDAYGYSLNDVNKSLNSYYFPIPETFDVINRTSESSFSKKDYLEGNYAKINKQKIEEIYDPFVSLNTFPEYKNNQKLASEFIKKNYDPNYSIYDSENSENNKINKNNNVVTISVSVTFAIIILVAIAIIIFFIIYKKRKTKNN